MDWKEMFNAWLVAAVDAWQGVFVGVNIGAVIWPWFLFSLGLALAGVFLDKTMRAARSGSIFGVIWNALMLISIPTFLVFCAVYYPSNRLHDPIPWDVIGLAAMFYLVSLVVSLIFWMLFMQPNHSRGSEVVHEFESYFGNKYSDFNFFNGKYGFVLSVSTLIPMIIGFAISNPPVFLLVAIFFVIGWKVTGSRSYADGMLLRDYMIDNARDYYWRRAKRR